MDVPDVPCDEPLSIVGEVLGVRSPGGFPALSCRTSGPLLWRRTTHVVCASLTDKAAIRPPPVTHNCGHRSVRCREVGAEGTQHQCAACPGARDVKRSSRSLPESTAYALS